MLVRVFSDLYQLCIVNSSLTLPAKRDVRITGVRLSPWRARRNSPLFKAWQARLEAEMLEREREFEAQSIYFP